MSLHAAEKTSLFKKKNILVIGDVMLDVFSYGVIRRQSPEAPVPLVEMEREQQFVGGAANVAMNLHALGANATLLGAIGDDRNGKKLQELLDQSGILHRLVRSTERQTTIKQRIIAGGKHQLRLDSERLMALTKHEYAEIQLIFNELVKQADGVILQDYNKGVLSDYLITFVLEECNRLAIPVFVDPKADHFFDYTKCFLFKPNWREVCATLDMDINDLNEKTLLSASERLLEQLQCEHLVITLGSQGIFYRSLETKSSAWVPGIPAEVVDVSGAGDTVISVLAVSLLSGHQLPKAVEFANLAGKLICEKPGIASVSANDLLNK